MDRRTSLRWMLAAGATAPLLGRGLARAAGAARAGGYGTDPRVTAAVQRGEFWPLTLTPGQRLLAGTLADIILPADGHSPAATAVGVVDFVDEWVSAPYPEHEADRRLVVGGFAWLDGMAGRHGAPLFVQLPAAQQLAICDSICSEARAIDALRDAARFFARYRDLVAGGFYSTAAGRSDLGYIGNVPLARFDGPDPELLRRLGLA